MGNTTPVKGSAGGFIDATTKTLVTSNTLCGSILDALDEAGEHPKSSSTRSGKHRHSSSPSSHQPQPYDGNDPTSALFARALISEVTDNPQTMAPSAMAAREKRLLKAQERARRQRMGLSAVQHLSLWDSSGGTAVSASSSHLGNNHPNGNPRSSPTSGEPTTAATVIPPNPLSENRAQLVGGGDTSSEAAARSGRVGVCTVTIGLTLSRRHSEQGHPDTVTRQTAFDFNELQDREYRYVSSTDSSGWRAGGGERGGGGDHKVAAPDTVHIPILEIDADSPAAVDRIIGALARGEVFIPHMAILPEALSVNGVSPPDLVVRFGCERNDDLPPDEWPNWCLEFMHNQLYEYFRPVGARWTKRPFQITLAKKVRWRTVKHMNKFFAHSERVINAWREKGPQFLNPQLGYIEGGATPEEVARPHGIYLLRNGRPTNYFPPNFERPYTTKMTRSLLMNVIGKSWDKVRRDWTSEPIPRLVTPATLIASVCGCGDGGSTGFIASQEAMEQQQERIMESVMKGRMVQMYQNHKPHNGVPLHHQSPQPSPTQPHYPTGNKTPSTTSSSSIHPHHSIPTSSPSSQQQQSQPPLQPSQSRSNSNERGRDSPPHSQHSHSSQQSQASSSSKQSKHHHQQDVFRVKSNSGERGGNVNGAADTNQLSNGHHPNHGHMMHKGHNHSTHPSQPQQQPPSPSETKPERQPDRSVNGILIRSASSSSSIMRSRRQLSADVASVSGTGTVTSEVLSEDDESAVDRDVHRPLLSSRQLLNGSRDRDRDRETSSPPLSEDGSKQISVGESHTTIPMSNHSPVNATLMEQMEREREKRSRTLDEIERELQQRQMSQPAPSHSRSHDRDDSPRSDSDYNHHGGTHHRTHNTEADAAAAAYVKDKSRSSKSRRKEKREKEKREKKEKRRKEKEQQRQELMRLEEEEHQQQQQKEQQSLADQEKEMSRHNTNNGNGNSGRQNHHNTKTTQHRNSPTLGLVNSGSSSRLGTNNSGGSIFKSSSNHSLDYSIESRMSTGYNGSGGGGGNHSNNHRTNHHHHHLHHNNISNDVGSVGTGSVGTAGNQSLLSYVTRSTLQSTFSEEGSKTDRMRLLDDDGAEDNDSLIHSVDTSTAAEVPTDEELFAIGWAKALDEHSGSYYYFTLDRNMTVWENPLLQKLGGDTESLRSRSQSNGGGDPPGRTFSSESGSLKT